MQRELKEIISKVNADYCDIRYEKMNTTKITYNGQELTEIGANQTDGYVLRVLKNGGFASISITNREDIDRAIKIVSESATLLGRELKEKVKLELPTAAVDDVPLTLEGDPRKIPIDEKLSLLQHYNLIVLKSPNIQTTTLTYNEVYRDKYFATSHGSFIHQPLITLSIGGTIVAKRERDGLIQNVRATVGGSNGFNKLLNRDNVFLDKAKIASDLLDANPVKGGTYNLVLDPNMTGVFTHEAFGHFSEADIVENMPSLREKMKIGDKLGSDILNIIDDATAMGQVGYYKYDDEGVALRPVTLMEKGVLTGRLHSMKTSTVFNEPISGHTVAEDNRYSPIVRMGCIYIKPGNMTFDELLKAAGNGIYVIGAKGGQTNGENFSFAAQYAYEIKDGKLGAMVRDINIMGNLFTTLKNVNGIANDFKLSEAGGCGKGQLNIKSCHGGPHILIKDALIGGV
ncbi:MAG: TldD/PmbA family protein [Oligoflexia bacterium]|nr:TldD/PmbA family protein [Oligoflexia bacterium]